MNVQELLTNPPKIHGSEEARTSIYRIEDAMFAFLDTYLREGMNTLEIGAGTSTIIFAIKKTRHTCIVPDLKQLWRIKEYCELHNISLDNVNFIIEKSQYALPKITQRDHDCILIDGNHGFPVPFVDWYYCAGLLKLGGVVIVDDLYIWTCGILADFLREQPEWRTIKETSRTMVSMKIMEGSQDKEWTHQKYVLRRSRATAILPKISYITNLLRRGQITLFFQNIILRIKRK
ncbi:MAG: class I SAM-dependent methyltransferase [Kouleothrix sp.]|jgi:predicted O-methyltransferase YrrM|nr:class I SAM-dependent methyltransferase [Kouleothrix sp.]